MIGSSFISHYAINQSSIFSPLLGQFCAHALICKRPRRSINRRLDHRRGGAYLFSFHVPSSYPHEPPKVKCHTKVFHPNLDLEGNICLNILREDWKPVLSINSILHGLGFLFIDPNADVSRRGAAWMVSLQYLSIRRHFKFVFLVGPLRIP